MSPIVKLENVNFWYNYKKENQGHALTDINIEINKGDYVAFFGPSGCGKTTLLYAISGIDRPQEGKILINDRDITGLSNQELAIFRQTGIGIVFQQFNLVPSLTVLQNVALPMAFLGINRDKADKEASIILERLNMGKYADRYPQELSGGQQQRVGIARALANNPPIIIADEPLGNLDSVNANNVLAFLKELNEKDGRTIIMVTHEAWSLQDTRKIFHMKDGVVMKTEIREKKAPMSVVAEQLSKESSSEEREQMAIRVLSNFFMRGYSINEMERFEGYLKKRFTGEIDAITFRKVIDLSYKEGGVGLWSGKASRVGEFVESVIEKRHDIDAILSLVNEYPEIPIADEVKRIRMWCTEEYKGKLSPYQIVVLDEVITDRLKKNVNSEQFCTLLDTSIKKFGVGISFRSAQKISQRLESIVSGTGRGQQIPSILP